MKTIKNILLILILFTLTGCADHVSFDAAKNITPVGFWYGLWHGIILPFAWVISLFSDNVAVYAIYNNGGWYNFGFLLGVGGLGGGTSVKVKSRR